jgi:cell division protein FtsI (penicillin-binding protein 3)
MKIGLFILLGVAVVAIIGLLILLFIRKNTVKKEIILRFAIVYIFIFIAFGGVVFRIVHLQYVEGDKLRELTASQQSSLRPIKPNRGNILASDGRLLASSIPTYFLYMDLMADALVEKSTKNEAEFKKEVRELSQALAKKFKDKSAQEYEKQFLTTFYDKKNKRKREYLLYPKPISYIELAEVKNFPILERGRYRGGFYTKKRVTRIKPFGELASRTIGDIFGEEEKGGRSGLEKQYDTYLRGEEGFYYRRKMAGQFVDIVVKDATNGYDVVSTIDLDIQDIVDSELRKKLIEIDAQSATAIVMEVKTGQIKAISNLTRRGEGVYLETTNIALADEVEPGSTFKTMALMIALDDGVVDTTAIVHTGNGLKQFSRRVMRDHNAHKGGMGTLTMPQILYQSSNVGTSSIIYEHYGQNPQRFIEALKRTKIHEAGDLGIPGHGHVKIKDPSMKSWYNTTLPWMSIGYEIQLPPIYTLMYYNAFANNGQMMKPYFTQEIRQHGVPIKQFEPIVLNPNICKEATLGKIQSMLEGVVTKGTGKVIKSKLFSIAGKTGTAQIAIGGKYKQAGQKAKLQVSFAGYFPADKPMYSMIVYIKDPMGAPASAGGMSGVVFKNIAEKVYTMKLGDIPDWAHEIPKDSIQTQKKGFLPQINTVMNTFSSPIKVSDKSMQWGEYKVNDSTKIASFYPFVTSNDSMPNTIGMSAKDAVYMLEKMGLKVRVTGYGKVVEQTIPKDEQITQGMEVMLTLH